MARFHDPWLSPVPYNMHTGGYVYMEDLLALDRCRRGEAPHPSLCEIITPLQGEAWAAALSQHPDTRFKSYILDGIKNGFRIGFQYVSHSCRSSTQNMASALEHPHIIGDYLGTECALGRIVGPVPLTFIPGMQVSRFGVIPKKQVGKWRLICDLSSPPGMSVNDGIPSEACSLSYVKVDDAAQVILSLGVGALLAKVDIKSAYRIVPVHPQDRHLLGMQWQGQAFFECALPFGLRSAPKIFTAVADAAEWILSSRGIHHICHYLDDFLLVGPPHSPTCKRDLDLLVSTFDQLGIPIAEDKMEGPSTSLVFLGIEIDTVSGVLRLPPEKVSELSMLIKAWLPRRSCTKQELQSLVGKFQHACKVVASGRTFLRRMFELLSVAHQQHHHIRLSKGFKSDLVWWSTFLQAWNGTSYLASLCPTPPSVHVFTDASGLFGCGAVWGSEWLQLQWTESSSPLPITQKEVLAIVIAIAGWAKRWQNQSVCVHSDNEAAVTIINAGYSKDTYIMHLLRCLFFVRSLFCISVTAKHIPGVDNVWADSISRNHLPLFFSQMPSACSHPLPIRDELIRLLMSEQPDWMSPRWSQLFSSCFQRE